MAEKIEDSPEFKKALNEACEVQYRDWLYGGDYAKASSKGTVADTMEGIQKQRKEIEEKVEGAKLHAERVRREAEIMWNPHAREITENLSKLHSVDSGVICPKCHETNSHGNRNNGKPYCYRCQLQMMSREKAEKWIKSQQPKKFSRGFDEPDGIVRLRK